MTSLLALAPRTTASQDEAAQGQEEPAPGVGRVSLIHGDVSTRRGDSGDASAAAINAPLVRGDQISTGARSRAEVELDHANVLRLDQRAEAKLADLTRTRIQLQVSQGTVNYTVFKGTEADVEIDTPNVSVHPLGEGSYRIQVNSQSETQVIVREGEAEVSTSQGSVTLEKNKLITVQGADNPEYQVAKAPGRDDWDKWNRDRDDIIENAASWGHTNRNYTGAHDLDRYGRWEHAPDYGDVWVPDAGPDFAPYRDGRWVWEPYYGWTWDSYEPWGWAPYHYGRWFLYDDYWAWWPGPIYPAYYPLWSPAFVSFFGFGRGFGFGFGFGFGSIGWLPIGPCDPFFPWWGRSSFNVINVTNITNITNIKNITNTPAVPPLKTGPANVTNVGSVLNNGRLQKAITTMPAANFGKGRVPQHPAPVTTAMLRQGKMVAGTVPAVPTKASLSASGRAARPGSVPTNANQRFFAKTQPPAGPKSFTEQAARVQQTLAQQHPLAPSNLARPADKMNSSPRLGAAPATPSMTARPAEQTRPAAGARTQTAPTPQTAPNSGWQRFGGGNAHGSAPTRNTFPSVSAPPVASRGGVTPPTRPAPQAPSERLGWQRFSSTPRAQTPTSGPRQSFTPQSSGRGASAPPSFSARQAPSTSNAPSGGWQRFGSRSSNAPMASAPAERGSSFSAPRSAAAPSGGWSRFTPRSEGAPARHTYDRPPLEMSRPIVSSRSDRGSGYNAPAPRSNGGSGYSAPAPRSYGGGGGYSAPAPRSYSGGGYNAPAPRSYGGGGGYSAPASRSYGGGGYSAPAPRSYGGGGGGGRSAPSGGGGYRGGGGSGGGGGGSHGGGGGYSGGGGGGGHASSGSGSSGHHH